MTYDLQKHRRRSIRLKGYDYSRPGMYFITICTYNRECLFGRVVDGEMRLNVLGKLAQLCWQNIPRHFPHAALDEFIMPNHVHGILIILDTNNVGAQHAVPLQNTTGQFGKPTPVSIPTIIRSFKSVVTKRINEMRGTPGVPVWQRNYYEHIVRDGNELNRIRKYIVNNPLNWTTDQENTFHKRYKRNKQRLV